MTSTDPKRKYTVRRLMPVECAMLMGFPPDWDADIKASDATRYMMWGNSVAVPCVEDVLGRIAQAERGE